VLPASPGAPTNGQFVFFILGAGWQIGGIDESDGGGI
jgi:hypothetical protein